MLSRVADSLYWMSRYFERADNCARVIDATHSLMLNRAVVGTDERWFRALTGMGMPLESCDDDPQAAIGRLAVDAGNRSSIVWGTTPDHARTLLGMDDATFNQALQSQMGERLGSVAVEGPRAAYPLVMQIADRFIGTRVALIGDAAHAIHPLAGLGLNLGFKDVAALADAVAQTFARGGDIGHVSTLEPYQMARRFDTVFTSFAMDVMNGLFVNNNPVLKSVRDLALKAVDQAPFAKTFFMAQAGGQSPRNPRLMQGLYPG